MIVKALPPFALLCVLLLVPPLSACSAGESPNGGGTGVAVTPDAGCTDGWPSRLRLETTSDVAGQFLEDVVTCLNRSSGGISVLNNGPLVWSFRDSSGESTDITPLNRTAVTTEFRQLSQGLYPHGFVAPGEKASVGADAGTLQWAIHAELSTAWMANGFLLEQLKKQGDAALQRALAGESASRTAIRTCTKAVYDVGASVQDRIGSAGYDPAGQISQGIGINDFTGACARAWIAAEREAGATEVPRWAQVADEVDIALRPGAELSEKAAFLKNAVQATLPLLCKVFDRTCG